MSVRKVAGILAFVLAWGAALGWLDRWASQGGRLGWERNAVRGALNRVDKSTSARGVVLLGSSTSRDWLSPMDLAGLFEVPKEEVVDAHINGCHQGCTWAQVRRLLADGRHFSVAIYGTNQFQLCEHAHSKRVLQHRMLVPTEDAGVLLGHYLRAREPLTYFARFFGGWLSSTYADTTAVQSRLREIVLGHPTRREHRWVRSRRPPPNQPTPCPYRDEDVAYKLTFARDLLDDLRRLADRVYLVLLPDSSLSSNDPEVREAWHRHRDAHQRLAAERPGVVLIDLSVNGAAWPHQFRDGFHLVEEERPVQLRQFSDLIKADRAGLPNLARGREHGS